MDPWYDFLAIPIAPLVLLVQGAFLYVPQRAVRLALSGVATVAIAAMLVYIVLLPVSDEEGANIGAGVMFIWLIASICLFGLAVTRPQTIDWKSAARRAKNVANAWTKAALASSLFLIFVYPTWFLIPVPIVTTALSWLREPSTRLRLAATALAPISVALVVAYTIIE